MVRLNTRHIRDNWIHYYIKNRPIYIMFAQFKSIGAGIVTEFSDHNKVIAHFVGDKNSARLSCSVMNGDVQTDTVWNVTYRDGTKIERIKSNELFKISGYMRQSGLESNLTYENYLDVIEYSVRELNGAVISCGSYASPSQVNVSMLFVCGK